jgi:hypothetical protein
MGVTPFGPGRLRCLRSPILLEREQRRQPRRDSESGLPGFVAAPLLVLTFGLQAVEAVGDLVRKRASLPVFHRVGWWLDRRGLPLVGLYLAVMVALLVALID